MLKHVIAIAAVLASFGLSTLNTSIKAESQSEPTGLVTTNVNIKLFNFKPKTLEVAAGTTVVWTNGDAVEHTVTSGTPEESAGTFDSGHFAQGKTFSFTFGNSGNYPYYCKRHDFMRGEIKVVPFP